MRGFARNVSPTPPVTTSASPAPVAEVAKDRTPRAVDAISSRSIDSDNKSDLDATGVAPPIQRFAELRDARELNGFDVELLLRDYQRIAGALRALQSSFA